MTLVNECYEDKTGRQDREWQDAWFYIRGAVRKDLSEKDSIEQEIKGSE